MLTNHQQGNAELHQEELGSKSVQGDINVETASREMVALGTSHGGHDHFAAHMLNTGALTRTFPPEQQNSYSPSEPTGPHPHLTVAM